MTPQPRVDHNMTNHGSKLTHLAGGKTKITCSCGKFEASVDVGFGKPNVRESHLFHAHKLHVLDATRSSD
ncbi:hypothetical protein GCM10029992_09730 [Glycomyces albus]